MQTRPNPGHKYLSYDELIPLLIEASQAQQDQLEQLKATNDQLVERLEVKQQATNQLQSQMRSMMDRIKELEAQVEDE